jgi:hypothetical protein
LCHGKTLSVGAAGLAAFARDTLPVFGLSGNVTSARKSMALKMQQAKRPALCCDA